MNEVIHVSRGRNMSHSFFVILEFICHKWCRVCLCSWKIGTTVGGDSRLDHSWDAAQGAKALGPLALTKFRDAVHDRVIDSESSCNHFDTIMHEVTWKLEHQDLVDSITYILDSLDCRLHGPLLSPLIVGVLREIGQDERILASRMDHGQGHEFDRVLKSPLIENQ